MSQTATRIIYMGTPEFAVPGLQLLIDRQSTHKWQIIAVATQPDRPSGRGKRVMASPVKQVAAAHKIPLLQPESLRRNRAAVEELTNLKPDLLVVAAYGLILPPSVLAIPTLGCVNVHASLLPAYRGASPITAAILDGLEETGVTIMLMDEGMDTGPSLAQSVLSIEPGDTTESLSSRLAEEGAELLVETLPKWISGQMQPIPQSELAGEPTTVRLIKKSAGKIDWSQSASYIERMTRAYTPWPSAFTVWNGQPLKIWRAATMDGSANPGQVVETKSGAAVGTGDGLLLLHEIQPAGKRRMDMRSFLNGSPEFIGSKLGD